MYRVAVRVTLRPSILDPQGKAVQGALQQLGQTEIQEVRMGKHADLVVDAPTEAAARAAARTACETLLANPVMEDFEIVAVEAVAGAPA